MINKIWSLSWNSFQRRVTNRLIEFKVPKWEVLWQIENANGGQGSRDSLSLSLGQVSQRTDPWAQLVGIWLGEKQRQGQNGYPNRLVKYKGRWERNGYLFFVRREFKAAESQAKPCSHTHKDSLGCSSLAFLSSAVLWRGQWMTSLDKMLLALTGEDRCKHCHTAPYTAYTCQNVIFVSGCISGR